MLGNTSGESPVLTVEEARTFLRLSRNSIYAAISRNEIPHLRIGKRILLSKAALERLLARGDRADGG